MNAHQRRKQKRLYEAAFDNHVCYYVEIPIRASADDNADDDGDYGKRGEWCPECGGTGIHWDGPEECPNCLGEGYVWW